jgi:hypothetical protein
MQFVHHCDKNSGFSLIQMSMVVAVGAVVAVSLMPGGRGGSDAEKEALTKQRMAAVEEATKNFMAANLRRPCPAMGSEPYNSGNGFIEKCGAEEFQSENISPVAGTIPTATLGLPPEMGLDGYGRRMMYVVDKRAMRGAGSDVAATNTCQDLQSQNLKGALEIAHGFDSPARENVMWALVSYGKDGHGAFPLGGSDIASRTNTSPTNEATIYNAFGDGITSVAYGEPIDGYAATTRNGNRLIQKTAEPGFDDTVWFAEETKNTCSMGSLATNINFRLMRDSESATTTVSAIQNGTVTATGDINGDGIQDLVTSFTGISKVYVTYGRRSGWPTSINSANRQLDLLASGTPTESGVKTGFTLTGSGINSFGRTIAVGDVDGDRKDDIVIGGERYYFVVFGESSKNNLTLSSSTTPSTTTGNRVFVIDSGTCPSAGTCPGEIAVGDVRSDGFRDIVFARTTNGATSATVQVYVIFGRSTWPVSAITTAALSTNGLTITTDTSNPFAVGYNSIAVGDFDRHANGKDEMLFGGRSADSAYLLFGTTGTSTIALNTAVASSTTGIKFTAPSSIIFDEEANSIDVFDQLIDNGGGGEIVVVGPTNTTALGQAVALVDLNNDNARDVVVASSTNVYVYNGRTSGWTASIDLNSSANVNFSSSTSINAITATDMSGDGANDLILSSSSDSSNRGIAYVVFRPTAGYSGAYTLTSLSRPSQAIAFAGPNTNSFTYDPTPVDLNGDGKMDLAIPSSGYTTGAVRGTVYMIMGRSNPAWNATLTLSDVLY